MGYEGEERRATEQYCAMHSANMEQTAANEKQVQKARTENAVISTRVTMLISGLLLCFTIATAFMGFTYSSVSRIEKQVATMVTAYSVGRKAEAAHEIEQQDLLADHESRIRVMEGYCASFRD